MPWLERGTKRMFASGPVCLIFTFINALISDAEVTEEMPQADEEGNLAHSLSNSGVML